MKSTGGITITCGLCVALLLRDSPADAGFKQDFTSATAKKKDNATTANASDNTWKDLIRSRFLWLVSGAYLIVFAAKTSVTEWGQMFLIEDLGHTPFSGSN